MIIATLRNRSESNHSARNFTSNWFVCCFFCSFSFSPAAFILSKSFYAFRFSCSITSILHLNFPLFFALVFVFFWVFEMKACMRSIELITWYSLTVSTIYNDNNFCHKGSIIWMLMARMYWWLYVGFVSILKPIFWWNFRNDGHTHFHYCQEQQKHRKNHHSWIYITAVIKE